ncbi:MAG: hypothetical protein FJ042_02655 [Candidatus Cloacimonetes bacterium]|nr:hypothetical protein [Candidatus Cloacimonadota bacterium]
MRTKIILLLVLITMALNAQVHKLPDVDVTGIENTRSFIYKSNILPDIEPMPLDSLPITLPRVSPFQVQPPTRPQTDRRNFFIDLGLSSANRTDLSVAVLLDSTSTSGLRFTMKHDDPQQIWSYQQYQLFIDLFSRSARKNASRLNAPSLSASSGEQSIVALRVGALQESDPTMGLGNRSLQESDPTMGLGNRSLQESDPTMGLGNRSLQESDPLSGITNSGAANVDPEHTTLGDYDLFLGLDYSLSEYADTLVNAVIDPYQNNLLSLTLYARKDDGRFLNLSLSDIRAQAGLGWHFQKRGNQSTDRLYADLDASFNLDLLRTQNRTRLSLIYWQPAMMTGIDLNPYIPIGPTEGSHLGFMADKLRFVPFLAFRYEYAPSLNSRIIIDNKPEIVQQNMGDYFENYRWFDLADDFRHTKIPLSLRIGYYRKTLNLAGQTCDRFSVTNTLSYCIDAPVIASIQPHDPIPTISSAMIATNLTRVDLSGSYRGFQIRQGLAMQVSYLYQQNLKRAPYQPMFILDTALSRLIKDTRCTLTINQQYSRIDHESRPLPEYVNLSFGLDRDLLSGLTASASVANIMGSHFYAYRHLPRTGTQAELRIKYLF